MDRAAYMKLEKSYVIFTLLLLVVVAIFTAVSSDIAIFLFGESGT
jgi:uncharacterized membrane protein